jgi:2-hydroxy-3-oxopropionate reductase
MKAMAGSVVLTGEIGAGNVTKLANQIIVALNIAAMSEALVLAAKAGVEPELVYNAIRGGLAGSTVLDAKAPLVMDRKFNPAFASIFTSKISKRDRGRRTKWGRPCPDRVGDGNIQSLKVDGMGDLDHGAIACYYEQLAKTEVRPEIDWVRHRARERAVPGPILSPLAAALPVCFFLLHRSFP